LHGIHQSSRLRCGSICSWHVRERVDNSLKKARDFTISSVSVRQMVGLVVALVTIGFVIFPTSVMQSEQSSRHVKTAKDEYLYGETVIVSGNVGQINENKTLRLVVEHTTGETVHRDENVTVTPGWHFQQGFQPINFR
jgi:hypothetical protein